MKQLVLGSDVRDPIISVVIDNTVVTPGKTDGQCSHVSGQRTFPLLPGRLSPLRSWQGGDRTQKWNIAHLEKFVACWNRVDLSILSILYRYSFLNVSRSVFSLEGSAEYVK